MKRVIKTASAILLALAMTTPAFAAPTDTDTTTDTPIATPTAAPSTSTRFTDINSEEFAWAKSYINDMAGKGFISGYEDNTFRPDNDVTRLEALSLFARAMGSNDSANTELLEIAHDKFDSVIKEYGLKWGTDEIAYLMYKGALKKTDLDTYLKDDEKDKESSNDFGKNIIPKMLNEGRRIFAYPFKGYWKDVGTISSLWEANMDLLKRETGLTLYDDDWKIYSVSPVRPAQYIGPTAKVRNSLVVEGCTVHGTVENSVLFEGVTIGKNSVIRDSVIMTGAKIGENVTIEKAIIGAEAIVRRDCKVGNGNSIAVIASKEEVKSGTVLEALEA